MNKTKKTILENPKTGKPMTREEAVHYQCPDIEEYDRMFAAGYNQTMEEEEEKYAQKHALEYKRENDVLRVQIQEQRKSHEMEIARLKAYYEAEVSKLKKKKQGKTNFVFVFDEEEKDKESDKKELTLSVPEIANLVKDNFSKESALEVATMLYHLVIKRGCIERELLEQIDSIVPAVIKRERAIQSVDISTAAQVNINPQQVINHTKEEKE